MDACPIKCHHEGHFTPRVYIDRGEDGRFMARISLRCEDCKEWFQFLGVAPGVDYNGARVSADQKELRIALGTPETLAAYYAQAVDLIRPKVIKTIFTNEPEAPRRIARRPNVQSA